MSSEKLTSTGSSGSWPMRFALQSLLLHGLLVIIIFKPRLMTLVASAQQRRYRNSHLTRLDVEDLKRAVLETLEAQRPYRNEKFQKPELAEMLDITTHQLGELLTQHIGMTFSELVNERRCIYLARQMMAVRNQNVLELAFEAGFNSKSVMNTWFKKTLGTTPTEFRKMPLKRQAAIIEKHNRLLSLVHLHK